MPLLKWCEEAMGHIDQLTSDKSTSVDYVLFTLENPKKNPTMTIKDPSHVGKGGRQSVETILMSGTVDDVILTGAFLTSAIDERGSVVSVRRKYVHVMWVGPNVGVLVKGKANSFSGEFRDKFPGCALYLQLLGGDIDDLMAETLEHNLLSAGGAHKPTRYSFTNRTLIGSLDIQESEQQPQPELPPRKTPEEIEAERKARLEAAEAKRKAEEEAKRIAAEEEAARQKALEEARQKAEQERIAAIRAQEEARRKAREEELRKAAAAEKSAREAAAKTKHLVQTNSTLNGKRLLLLITGMPKDLATDANQNRLQIMVDALGLPQDEVKSVDGADMSFKDRRNQLFDVSGLRAQYPQLFIIEKDTVTIKFIGDFDTVIYYNDTEQLKDVLGVTTKTTTTTIEVGKDDDEEEDSQSPATVITAATVSTTGSEQQQSSTGESSSATADNVVAKAEGEQSPNPAREEQVEVSDVSAEKATSDEKEEPVVAPSSPLKEDEPPSVEQTGELDDGKMIEESASSAEAATEAKAAENDPVLAESAAAATAESEPVAEAVVEKEPTSAPAEATTEPSSGEDKGKVESAEQSPAEATSTEDSSPTDAHAAEEIDPPLAESASAVAAPVTEEESEKPPSPQGDPSAEKPEASSETQEAKVAKDEEPAPTETETSGENAAPAGGSETAIDPDVQDQSTAAPIEDELPVEQASEPSNEESAAPAGGGEAAIEPPVNEEQASPAQDAPPAEQSSEPSSEAAATARGDEAAIEPAVNEEQASPAQDEPPAKQPAESSAEQDDGKDVVGEELEAPTDTGAQKTEETRA